ncbi:3-oxoacyl-ACP synthase III family protein [Actinosynnema sp. NPDC023658]|uniref:3-oxoacyl-ACP synthase III family protein n=1 Tax=Actinosynnema sp. NPDC023658 TaxID=3155465 RepID=UPI0033D60C70
MESGEVGHTLTDLGETAARRALTAAGKTAGEVDLVVMGTATPDMLMPATVNLIADRLGIDGVPTFQLQSGCSGAVQALEIAGRLMSTGRYRTALVLGGDVSARHYDLRVDVRTLSPAEVVNVVLFGDGAGAAVLGVEPTADSVAVRTVFTRLTGLGREPGQVIRWFGLADRGHEQAAGAEDYKMIEESVPAMSEEILKELLDEAGWTSSEVDYLLPPQLSGRMTRKIVDRLGVPGATEVSCVSEVGNNGNALVFFQLERALAAMGRGERAVGIAVESSKWIKAGFALEKV